MIQKNTDIRWSQRFQNYEKAIELLERTIKIKELSEAERGGLIQFYEAAFELAWKLMKDYLVEQGFNINSPRDAIKQSFQSNIIQDGHQWINALNDRNLTTHIYDEETASRIASKIKDDYFDLLKQLYLFMKEKMKD